VISSPRADIPFEGIHSELRASLPEIDGVRVIVQQLASGDGCPRRDRGKGGELGDEVRRAELAPGVRRAHRSLAIPVAAATL